MNCGIYVGVSEETVQEISNKIMEILSAKADQETIRCALGVLRKATKSPEYTTIKDCSITMTPSSEEGVNDE